MTFRELWSVLASRGEMPDPVDDAFYTAPREPQPLRTHRTTPGWGMCDYGPYLAPAPISPTRSPDAAA